MDVRFVSDDGIQQHPVGELEQLLARDHGFVWVDIPVCDEEAARVLSEVFGFHPLAIQACIERNAVAPGPGLPDHVFVVQHAPELGEGGHVHYVELDQFIGAYRFVVTVHGPVNPAVTPEAALRETARCWGGSRRSSCTQVGVRVVLCDRLRLAEMRGVHARRSHVRSGRLSNGSPRATLATPSSSWKTCSAPGMACWRCPIWPPGPQIYQRMSALKRFVPLIASRWCGDLEDQFARVGGVADGQVRYLEGVIDFYEARTDTKMTIAAEW